MTTQQDAPETVDVRDRDETLTVPTTFDRADLSAWYGDVPETIPVDRIYRFEGIVRAEMLDGADIVEVGYFRDGDPRPGLETGWVAMGLDDGAVVTSEQIGETLWERGE